MNKILQGDCLDVMKDNDNDTFDIVVSSPHYNIGINYNTYEKDEEYTWHIDATSKSPVSDIKLTCLLNLSEDNYNGGELILFKGKEVECKEFNLPGSAVVFPSFTNHKVNKLTSGNRNTLAIWMTGPKFR